MAFIELSDILFRGQLRGATGQARFKLTTKALNAVDTLNIAGNQVTYSTYIRWYGGAITNGWGMFTHWFDVPDGGAYVEIVAYAQNAGTVSVDGAIRPNRNRRGPGFKCLPFVEILPLSPGQHFVQMIAALSGSSSGGFVLCRYIRPTGSSNT